MGERKYCRSKAGWGRDIYIKLLRLTIVGETGRDPVGRDVSQPGSSTLVVAPSGSQPKIVVYTHSGYMYGVGGLHMSRTTTLAMLTGGGENAPKEKARKEEKPKLQSPGQVAAPCSSSSYYMPSISPYDAVCCATDGKAIELQGPPPPLLSPSCHLHRKARRASSNG